MIASSCNKVFTRMYGIHAIKNLSDKKIDRVSDAWGIPAGERYTLDTSWWRYWEPMLDDSTLKAEANNHWQPLQVMFFDSSGQLVSFHVNCYAGGFPNLQWNYKGAWDQFVPKTLAPADSLISFKEVLKYIKGENGLSPQAGPAGYYVVVFWNKWMGRQSRRLLRQVQENLALAEKAPEVYYVNTDKFWYWLGG